MCAEVTFLSRMIVGIDEDRIVRTRCHAGFATDTDRLIEVDNAIGTFKHGRGWTSSCTRSMRALVAAGDLVSSSGLRKHSDVNVLDVSACDRDRNYVFRFARSRAGVTSNTASVVDYLCPLNRARGTRGACHLSNYNIADCRFPIVEWPLG